MSPRFLTWLGQLVVTFTGDRNDRKRRGPGSGTLRAVGEKKKSVIKTLISRHLRDIHGETCSKQLDG